MRATKPLSGSRTSLGRRWGSRSPGSIRPMDDDASRAMAAASAAFAVITGYFALPILRFLDPSATETFGLMLATGVAGSWLARMLRYGRMWEIPMIALTLIGFLGLGGLVILQGVPASDANKTRCMGLQNDMLSVSPRRRDGPQLFQALGCEPHGVGPVEFSPPLAAQARAQQQAHARP